MKVTKELLELIDACSSARYYVEDLLPVKLYLDVEKNIPTAIRIINYYSIGRNSNSRCKCNNCRSSMQRSLTQDLYWMLLSNNRTKQYKNERTLNETSYNMRCANDRLDPLMIAQILSWICE